MDVKFKKVQISEANELLQIAKKTFIHTYEHLNDPDQFRAYIDNHLTLGSITKSLNATKSHFYFGRIHGNIVSYFHVLEFPIQTDINTADSLEISRFYVLHENKGKGICRQMMNQIKTLASGLSKKEIWLGVWQHNPTAIAFYKKMGFAINGTHSFLIGTDEQTDYIMKYRL